MHRIIYILYVIVGCTNKLQQLHIYDIIIIRFNVNWLCIELLGQTHNDRTLYRESCANWKLITFRSIWVKSNYSVSSELHCVMFCCFFLLSISIVVSLSFDFKKSKDVEFTSTLVFSSKTNITADDWNFQPTTRTQFNQQTQFGPHSEYEAFRKTQSEREMTERERIQQKKKCVSSQMTKKIDAEQRAKKKEKEQR